MPRFALLEHSGAPDDPAGLHYDLLLESGETCRTWRLAGMPVAGGPAVAAVELPRHRLAWLDHEAGEVSGGRGFARRIVAGECQVISGAARDCASPSREEIVVDDAVRGVRYEISRTPAEWTVTAR